MEAALQDRVAQQLRESAELKMRLADELADAIATAAAWIVDTYQSRGKLLLFGNGGSAADAQHLAAELTCRLQRERPALAAIALTSNTSVLTAQANDHGFETVFARQVEALARAGDLALAFSCSGCSANVVNAVRYARSAGMRTIALTGAGGGELAHHADLTLMVPSHHTPRVQEAHMTIGHILCDLVESALFGP
jgi:D-sedoheptulose 7-phosphate isomerase